MYYIARAYLATSGVERIQSKIDGKYLEAYKKAFEELGIKEVSNPAIHKRVSNLLEVKP